MKIVGIIQARMGSTRLPGKVMRDLCGQTVLAHVVRRVAAARNVARTVVATTTLERDDVVAAEARRLGAGVFRGSEEDVLSRYYEAARAERADVVVRVTGDCPLVDPELIAAMADRFLALQNLDYLSNALTRTYPRGFDTEVFSMKALEGAWREATTPAEREHVTPFMYRHPERFRLENFAAVHDRSRYRLTLDTPADWEVIEKLVRALGGGSRIIPAAEVIDYLDRHPDVANLNAGVEQRILE